MGSGRYRTTKSLTVLLLLVTGELCFSDGLLEAKQALRQREYQRAEQILLLESNKKNSEASYLLASLYLSGTGLPKSAERAFQIAKVSAQSNHPKSQYLLGGLYERGEGVKKDYDQALFWYEKSLKNGYRKAERKLELLERSVANFDVKKWFSAVSIGSIQELARYLKNQPELLNTSGEFSQTALHQVIQAENWKVARWLIEQGANPNLVDDRGDTPLILSIGKGNLGLSKQLYRSGASITGTDAGGNSLLMLAIKYRHGEMIDWLLGQSIALEHRNNAGETALDLANNYRNSELAELLVKRGARSGGATPESSADQYISVAKRSRSEPESRYYRWSALQIAVWERDLSAVTSLLKRGASWERSTVGVPSPLQLAVVRGDLDILDLLLRQPVNQFAPFMAEACAEAVSKGNASALNRLLKYEIADAPWTEWLMSAEQRRDQPIFIALIAAAPRESIDWSRLPLQRLVAAELHLASQWAISQGGPLAGTDDQGRDALWWAAHHGYLDLIKLLHTGGLSIDRPSKQGNTPLHTAAAQGHTEVIDYLLLAGSDYTLRNRFSFDALMIAVANNRREVVEKLLKAGANPARRDSEGNSSMDIAREAGNQELLKLLERESSGFSVLKILN